MHLGTVPPSLAALHVTSTSELSLIIVTAYDSSGIQETL